jgi:hypothetical protein
MYPVQFTIQIVGFPPESAVRVVGLPKPLAEVIDIEAFSGFSQSAGLFPIALFAALGVCLIVWLFCHG